ncbi:DNA (cytosine-5)-methyltransferase CMT1 [Sesamum angolense]|uniref:DNA (cytosine-5-)-methyltransferase n=1 Tax=Sesamum angolense TaxID=2727404 RepID=A0AAE1X480_9LAMI|nr:DNA (cytosine-5)-methyltransferase CMT1 [Sesamum angolense]
MGRGRKRAEVTSSPSKPSSSSPKKLKKTTADDGSLNFVGAPVPADEAQSRWPHRYQSKSKTATILVTLSDGSTEEKEFFQAICHSTKAIVDGVEFNLFDDAYIQVIKDQDYLIDTRRVFYSDVRDDNPLSCISSKVKIGQLATNMDTAAKEKAKNSCDLYVDMMYTFPHAFTSLYIDNENSSVTDGVIQTKSSGVAKPPEDFQQSKELFLICILVVVPCLLDLVLVRNEDAEDFFVLLKEWESLCKEFNLLGSKEVELEPHDIDSDESEVDDCLVVPSGEFEVEKLIAICYGDPNNVRKRGLHFKVRWKGYGRADDTWEPIDGLCKCKEKIKEFVSRGYRARILPLPGQLASYAVGRLVSMNYQARLGIMAAGAYGVPQCRMRFFLWGAGPMESLPQFPLPTHKVLKKGVVINEFKEIIVGHGNEPGELHTTVLLGDVISDLPEVANDADQDEMPYDIFGYTGTKKNDPLKSVLYDHRPLQLNQDDYERVCHVPKVKGANFRNLPGVLVGPDNVVRLDPSVKRALCTSGKPLVILHPDQDRVLSVRENARLQGFPDCYKLYGPIKESPANCRYMQVGNAVSFSVSIPLGYCLAKAMQGASSTTPLTIPFQFPDCLGQLKSARQESELDAVAFAG